MRISRMLPQGHPAAAQQIARRTPQMNAGVAVGVVNRSARGIYYWSVETTSTVVFVFGVRVSRGDYAPAGGRTRHLSRVIDPWQSF